MPVLSMLMFVYFNESGALNDGIKLRVIVCVVNLLWRGPPCVFFVVVLEGKVRNYFSYRDGCRREVRNRRIFLVAFFPPIHFFPPITAAN